MAGDPVEIAVEALLGPHRRDPATIGGQWDPVRARFQALAVLEALTVAGWHITRTEQVGWCRPNPWRPKLGGPLWRMRGLYEDDDPGDAWTPAHRIVDEWVPTLDVLNEGTPDA
jgi:hypothetical protein